jgi:hypothetical protein
MTIREQLGTRSAQPSRAGRNQSLTCAPQNGSKIPTVSLAGSLTLFKEQNMKKIFFAVALAASLASQVSAAAQDEAAMKAEMEKCAVCKNLAANPELMNAMTWETHKIDNGMLCVSTVPKEKKSDFDALNAKMKASIEQVKADEQQGKTPEICELCKGMGDLLKAGAKEKEIALSNGAIHMLTSDDPAVVAKIHAEADKAIDMQKQIAQK